MSTALGAHLVVVDPPLSLYLYVTFQSNSTWKLQTKEAEDVVISARSHTNVLTHNGTAQSVGFGFAIVEISSMIASSLGTSIKLVQTCDLCSR